MPTIDAMRTIAGTCYKQFYYKFEKLIHWTGVIVDTEDFGQLFEITCKVLFLPTATISCSLRHVPVVSGESC